MGIATKVLHHLSQKDDLLSHFISLKARQRALYRNADRLVSQGLGKHFKELNLKSLKTSDTIFILGSGASVNEFDENHWQIIEKNDSIGFNFWAIHEFVPTIYFFEIPRNQEAAEILANIFSYKAQFYVNTPIIVKTVYAEDISRYQDFIQHSFPFKNFYFATTHEISGSSSEEQLKNRIRNLRKLNYLKCNQKHVEILFQQRASLSYLALFSYLAGYKNIVLCGVDLNNGSYFYESEEFKKLPFKIPYTNREYATVHKTVNPSDNSLTIDKVLEIFQKQLYTRVGVQLYIGSKSSLLYPYLPYYFE